MQVGDRSKAVLAYLQKNGSKSNERDEFLQCHAEELGARLMMDVRVGSMVTPVFVYDPASPKPANLNSSAVEEKQSTI